MNKTELINIAKQPFYIETPAYKILKDYLDDIKTHYDAQAVLDDIECSIAEKLAGTLKTKETVVELSEIKLIIDQLGSVDDIASSDGEKLEQDPSSGSKHAKRLFRDTKNGELGGVAAGLAAYFGIDVTWVRLAFVIITFLNGFGILLYLIMWVITPEAKTLKDEYAMRGRNQTLIDIERNVKEKAKQFTDSGFIENSVNLIVQAIKAVIKAIGVIVVALAITAMASASVVAIGMLTHLGFVNLPQVLTSFPNTNNEYALIISSYVAVLSLSILLIQLGLSLMTLENRRLKLYTLIGLITVLITSGIIAGLSFTAARPNLQKALESSKQPQVRQLNKFDSITAGGNVNIKLVKGDDYSVKIDGVVQPESIKTDVSNGRLNINKVNGLYLCLITCDYDSSSVVISLPQDASISDILLKDQSRIESNNVTTKTASLFDQSYLGLSTDININNLALYLNDQSIGTVMCKSLQQLDLTAKDQATVHTDGCPTKNGDLVLKDQSNATVNVMDSLSLEQHGQSDFEQTGKAE